MILISDGDDEAARTDERCAVSQPTKRDAVIYSISNVIDGAQYVRKRQPDTSENALG